eukprot:5263948-Karenia_brevis.AAC.1
MSGHSSLTTENLHCVSSSSLLIICCSSGGANTSISGKQGRHSNVSSENANWCLKTSSMNMSNPLTLNVV